MEEILSLEADTVAASACEAIAAITQEVARAGLNVPDRTYDLARFAIQSLQELAMIAIAKGREIEEGDTADKPSLFTDQADAAPPAWAERDEPL